MTAIKVEHRLRDENRNRMCLQETAGGRLCQRSASARVTILGHSWRCCTQHAREAGLVWDRALAGFPEDQEVAA